MFSGLTVFFTEKERVFFKPIGHKSAKKGSKSEIRKNEAL